MAAYLPDSSLWIRGKREPRLRAKVAERYADGELRACVPVVLEVLHGARDAAEYEEELATYFEPLEWLPLTEAASIRALDVQRQLASTTAGAHRVSAVDYLIAAIADEGGAVLWHADRDLRRICALTGQAQEHERVR